MVNEDPESNLNQYQNTPDEKKKGKRKEYK